jgi:hypothetical protein
MTGFSSAAFLVDNGNDFGCHACDSLKKGKPPQ